MPTDTRVSIIQHNNDADFRAWSRQMSEQFQAAGLTKTANTGQINFDTVLRPATNTYTAYEIYRFSDALQATRPLFIKIEYGTGGTSTFPQIRVSVSSSTDGAGVMNGVVYVSNLVYGRAAAPNTNSSPSFAVYNNTFSFFGFQGWIGSVTSAPSAVFSLVIGRCSDEAGVIVDEAIYSMGTLPSNNFDVRQYAFMNSASVANSATCLVPSNISNSLIGLDAQVYRHYMATPRTRMIPSVLTHMNDEIARSTTFSTTAFGSTPRTYVATGDGTSSCSSSSNTSHKLAMMFE